MHNHTNMNSHWSKDNFRVICEQGIFYMALRSTEALDDIMFCGSITEAWYTELPQTWIVLEKEILHKNIVLLKENDLIEECEAKLEMISDNSFCLRVYKFNYDLGCEDDSIPFKIEPADFCTILLDNFQALSELYKKNNDVYK